MGSSSSKASTSETSEGAQQNAVPKLAYFDIEVRDSNKKVTQLGRATFLLSDKTPLTSANFGRLCEGFKLKFPMENRAGDEIEVLHYKNTRFHRVIPGFMCQFGDCTEAKLGFSARCRPGTGGGGTFSGSGSKWDDENFSLKHKVGALSMANAGPNTNGSQIFICTSPCDGLNGKHVVFGECADEDSFAVIKKVEGYGSRDGSTSADVYVAACGVLEYYD